MSSRKTAQCILEPRGESGLEGYSKGGQYEYEYRERDGNGRPYYRVWPLAGDDCYETCSVHTFKRFFSLDANEYEIRFGGMRVLGGALHAMDAAFKELVDFGADSMIALEVDVEFSPGSVLELIKIGDSDAVKTHVYPEVAAFPKLHSPEALRDMMGFPEEDFVAAAGSLRTAFGISDEDVFLAVTRIGADISMADAEELLLVLDGEDRSKIAAAALDAGTDMGEQALAAHGMVVHILKDKGLLVQRDEKTVLDSSRLIELRSQSPEAVPASLDLMVERMKREIIEDVRAGVVPKSVKSFSELHDHVDANCYGGFCSDQVMSALTLHFGGRRDEAMPEHLVDFINRAQNGIDSWIKSGDLVRAVDREASQTENIRDLVVGVLRDMCDGTYGSDDPENWSLELSPGAGELGGKTVGDLVQSLTERLERSLKLTQGPSENPHGPDLS